MKTWEALSILIAARNGDRWRLFERQDLEAHKDRAKRILRRVGMSEKELNDPFPEEVLHHGLHLLETDPLAFRRMAEEAQRCHIERN